MKQSVISFYTDYLRGCAVRIASLHRKSRQLFAGTVILFLLAVACGVAHTLWPVGRWWLAAGVVAFAGYVVLRRFDTKNALETECAEAEHAAVERELQGLAGTFSAFDAGERYASSSHAFSTDLDLFAPEGLYQRISRCVTVHGADVLATRLTTQLTPERLTEVSAFRETSQALSGEEWAPWRLRFIAEGIRGRLDTRRVTDAVDQLQHVPLPRIYGKPFMLPILQLLTLLFAASVAGALVGVLPYTVPLWWGLAHFIGAFVLSNRLLRTVSQCSDRLAECVPATARLLGTALKCEVETPLTAELRQRLQDAAGAFSAWHAMVDALDRRGNVLGLFLINACALADVRLLCRMARWQKEAPERIVTGVEALGRWDELVSAAQYRHVTPGTVEPEMTDEAGVTLVAKDLVHPFLGEKGVPNDIEIKPLNYYIVTGANMAGKSTFLRAVGVNVALAGAGLPVCARSFRMSVFRLFTGMRTGDDLSRGISYFNAELRRLAALLDAVNEAGEAHTLVILDEILKGTNSVDKLRGSRLFLEHMARKRASGIVATHDLALSELAQRADGRFHNLCFEIETGENVTYTYKMTAGVAEKQNATFLLKQLLAADTGTFETA